MNPMTILEMMFGKEKAGQLMLQWNRMSPEQKQNEMGRIKGLTDEQKREYLKNMGFDVNLLQQVQPQQQNNVSVNNETKRFNY